MPRYSSSLHPCGEFTIGYVKDKKIRESDAEYERMQTLQYEHHKWQEYYAGGVWNKELKIQMYDPVLDPERFERPLIGLSSPFICHKQKRKRRGISGMNSSQRRRVKDAAYILQERWGRKRLGFMTFTLPSLSKEQLRAFLSKNGGWANFIRKFLQELKRKLIRRGADGVIVGVTEFQEKRYRRLGQVAPHLHLTFCCRTAKGGYYVCAYEYRDIWKRCIRNHLKKVGLEDVPVDVKAGVDCQVVKKCVVGYLAKYMSKGGKVVQEIVKAEGEEVCPTSWLHLSSKLKRFIRLQIRRLDESLVDALRNNVIPLSSSMFVWIKEILIEFEENEFRLGWAGRFRQNDYVLDISEYDKALACV